MSTFQLLSVSTFALLATCTGFSLNGVSLGVRQTSLPGSFLNRVDMEKCGRPRFRPTLRIRMEGASTGAAKSYMNKIPAHLQGLAIRNVKSDPVKDWVIKKDDKEIQDIQKELDEEEEENHMDFAMEILEELSDDLKPRLHDYNIDLEDAAVLRELRRSMNPEDFQKIFGRGVGDLL
mmetsp:Transcript_23373/g.52493  ORF Transcript_23373/g.52493 Transcript_23373/m.52493 type:complete len:177 (-) Transcript_23373:145-675(-)|eukprot:767955-Hanusia_phi.AAC.12